jgi:anti-sigma factor RsiW
MPCDRLSDLATLEWARFGETRLAPDAAADVAAHLEVCGACRERVRAFADLDRLVHPYGTPPPVDPRPRRFRRGLAYGAWFGSAALLGWVAWRLFLAT